MSKRRKITPSIPDVEEKIIEQLGKAKPSGDSDKKTVRITLDIPKGLHGKIKAHTKARGLSIKGYLLFLASQDMES